MLASVPNPICGSIMWDVMVNKAGQVREPVQQ